MGMRLAGKVAMVTGAGSGIGRAIAVAMAREGARVSLVGRRQLLLQETAREIGDEVLVCAGDITHVTDVQAIVAKMAQTFGKLDVLVNNAAVLVPGTAESLTDDQWDVTFNTNVKAVWRMSREVLPWMRRAGGGAIVNISSVLGLVGAHCRVAYSASKGAVTLLTKSMALDHGHENVRVNCICPGIVETEMVMDFVRKAPDPEEARKVREALHALGRFGRPEDVAGMAVFLASDEARWITGAALPVDGGYVAGKA